jgi:endonuclease/exonuclease/phosphatase family metal-dependent hydrolase
VLIRAATFNVRTARATSDARNWLTRAPDVAAEIKARRPAVVMLQELGPGRADGRDVPLGDAPRQTTSLLTALQRAGVNGYRLVRTTSYIGPGVEHGTQGARILYDTSRLRLLSDCPETTGNARWNGSCSFNLPILGSNENERRRAAYAEFAEISTGKRFFAVSAHLDSRHSSNTTTEQRLNALRGQQAAAAVDGVARVNTDRVPVIFGGDVNSWQANRVGYAPHDALIARGFWDSAAAQVAYNLRYPTVNHFDKTLKRSGTYGSRLDVVMAKGVKGINRYENKLEVTSTRRPSDHNMVLGDVIL